MLNSVVTTGNGNVTRKMPVSGKTRKRALPLQVVRFPSEAACVAVDPDDQDHANNA